MHLSDVQPIIIDKVKETLTSMADCLSTIHTGGYLDECRSFDGDFIVQDKDGRIDRERSADQIEEQVNICSTLDELEELVMVTWMFNGVYDNLGDMVTGDCKDFADIEEALFNEYRQSLN